MNELNKRKIRLRLLLMIGLIAPLLTLVACSGTWWAENSCALPCWFGVQPGVTQLSEVDTLVERSPLEAYVRINLFEDGGSFRIFRNILDLIQGRDFAYGTAGGSPLVVDAIWCDLEQGLTLEDVIAQYGEPSHIWAYAGIDRQENGAFYKYEIVFINDGFSLVWNGLTHEKPDVPTGDLSAYLLFIFQPGQEGYEVGSKNPARAAELKEFSGTYNFDEYCTGDACED